MNTPSSEALHSPLVQLDSNKINLRFLQGLRRELLPWSLGLWLHALQEALRLQGLHGSIRKWTMNHLIVPFLSVNSQVAPTQHCPLRENRGAGLVCNSDYHLLIFAY